MKVHIIESKNTGHLTDAITARDRLGKAIGVLTRQVSEPTWFHDYKDSSGGAPLIFLECSDTFLELVKKLPDVKQTYISQPAIGKYITERSEKMQEYFTNDPNKFVHYYSLQFTPVKNAAATNKHKMTDAFNFQNLIAHARWAFMQVIDYLDQNSLLHQVSDVRNICNENRMILRCPDALVEDLKKLHCIESIRPLTAREIQCFHPYQPPACPPGP